MTNRDSERSAIIDELLHDAGLLDGPDIRQALLAVGSLASLPTPAPGPELAAIMAGTSDELSKRRWRPKHRPAVVSVAVIAAMGLGVGGVAAASSNFTRNASFVEQLLGLVPHPASEVPPLPVPDEPRISTRPAPATDPVTVPASPTVPATVNMPVTLNMPALPTAGAGIKASKPQPSIGQRPEAIEEHSQPTEAAKQAPPAGVGTAGQFALPAPALDVRQQLLPRQLHPKPVLPKPVMPNEAGRPNDTERPNDTGRRPRTHP